MFSSLARVLLVLLPLSSTVYGAAIPRHDNDHDHVSRSSLPTAWFHNDDHPLHALFRRQSTASTTFPVVGSPTWASAYPAGTPVASQMPQPWIDALNAAVQAGKIPNIPPPTQTAASTTPIYAQGYNPNDPSVCSTSYGCRNPGDIFDAPNGVMAIGFDDGPLPVSHFGSVLCLIQLLTPSIFSHPPTSTRFFNRTKSRRPTFSSGLISSIIGTSLILPIKQTRMILPCILGHTLI